MIYAILPDLSNTEALLNNLDEADFNLNDISVIFKDIDLRNKVAKDLGPLKGVELKMLRRSLIKLGLSKESAGTCIEAVTSGKVLVVMKVDDKYSPAAIESFQDHSAQLIKE